MNPLNDLPAVRKVLYVVQWIINGILVVSGVVFLTQGTSTEELPDWYVLALAVGPVLWTYLGITAQQNVDEPSEPVVEG